MTLLRLSEPERRAIHPVLSGELCQQCGYCISDKATSHEPIEKICDIICQEHLERCYILVKSIHHQRAGSATRRKPINFFSSIFRKKTKEPEIGITDASDETVELSDSDMIFEKRASLPENLTEEESRNSRPLTPPILVIPQPSTTSDQEKTLAEDMVALQLSHQDNPIIQKHPDHLLTRSDENKVSNISPTLSQPDQEILINGENANPSSDNLDSHSFRSPASYFDCSSAHLTYPEPNKSVLNMYDQSVTFHKRSRRELVPLTKPEKSLSYSPPLESLKKKGNTISGALKPLMSKSGIGVLDTRMKEILESQKQKLCLTGHVATTNKDHNRKTPLISQRNLPQTSQQAKWTSIRGTRPMSDYSNSSSLYTLKSFTSLNRLTVAQGETLRPLK
ncbi:uncharacterized protein LOC111088326 isoform X2 [Limulus polyphemus]|uniref:Uncharacterized protein LOC111088326 isoform X2 n=1 Tax=Limulus polyphemus TaxID=6850 RepID=A0ABM1TD55_LIMPO|nr:uncharacterized protein LOC111088326 isoform X2 [Limulus polyphemus]